MMLKRCVATLAAMAGCAFGVAAPTAAAAPAPGTTQAIPRGLVPTSTSWTSPQSGIVLAYTSLDAGAMPYLFVTGNGGRTWRPMPASPVPFLVPGNNPVATWADGAIAVTDRTHIVVTRDSGRRWSAVRLAGASGAFIGKLVIASGRMYALVQTQNGGTGSKTVYSGLVP
jgi:hypothetical protein